MNFLIPVLIKELYFNSLPVRHINPVIIYPGIGSKANGRSYIVYDYLIILPICGHG